MKKLFEIVFVLVLAVVFGYFVNQGIDRQEVVDCLKLEQQSKDFDLFFLTANEKAMCDSHGIIIVAPVK